MRCELLIVEQLIAYKLVSINDNMCLLSLVKLSQNAINEMKAGFMMLLTAMGNFHFSIYIQIIHIYVDGHLS